MGKSLVSRYKLKPWKSRPFHFWFYRLGIRGHPCRYFQDWHCSHYALRFQKLSCRPQVPLNAIHCTAALQRLASLGLEACHGTLYDYMTKTYQAAYLCVYNCTSFSVVVIPQRIRYQRELLQEAERSVPGLEELLSCQLDLLRRDLARPKLWCFTNHVWEDIHCGKEEEFKQASNKKLIAAVVIQNVFLVDRKVNILHI